MPRFVLLFHDWPAGPRGSHCDLMLEFGGLLCTWAIMELPQAWAAFGIPVGAADSVAVERLPDHRLDYLEYEGPVSGERGTVRQLDSGTFELIEDMPENCIVALAGKTIHCRIDLKRDGEGWQLSVA